MVEECMIMFKDNKLSSRWLYTWLFAKLSWFQIAIDFGTQQELDADPKAKQQINVTGNLDGAENTTIFFILEEAQKTILDFSQKTVRVL